ncbi:transketolase [Rhodocaloribacter litoris]|uniref:transketolase n=1 Tax=Rhodocaloribacter litoris TaxID=2558931 RepID=UPI001421868D
MTQASSAVDRALATELAQRSINTIRFLAVDAVQQANSGHPGMPMGMAAPAYVLWHHFLKHNPKDPAWPDRDRFVLSAGHGSMLLYALLHLTGYDLPMEELKRFRQWGSRTPGHPENFLTPGVETTTGPLGQGFANGVGMAIAERFLAARFNRPDFPVVDHYTYGIVSDGDLMEGISHEAASLAGHLGLGKLIYLYDDNEISIDGSTDLAFTEDVGRRFEAYGWQVLDVPDGNDLEAVARALETARSDASRPSLIITHTHIGYGSPNKQDTAEAHGAPLGEEEVRLTKRALGWPEEPAFFVPGEVYEHLGEAVERGRAAQEAWQALLERYAGAYPDEAAAFRAWLDGRLPEDWDADLPVFEPGTSVATRKASGAVLAALGAKLPNLIGGSADLTPSNNTFIKGRTDFQKDQPSGSYLRFGVREHAMAAICNGIALHGGLRPYCGTFLVFSDYMRPALRLSALMHLPVVYVFTHDSIGLGEDGPTHQPVEHAMSLRLIPNLTFIRPADAAETAEAWRVALLRRDGPTALALTRQGVPVLDRTTLAPAEGLRRGAYILSDDDEPELILMATGSEVALIVAASERLRRLGHRVRVVSMPSWELFEREPEDYRRAILPPEVTARVAVEAGRTLGWERYVGPRGHVIGLDRFGASAPGKVVFEKLGFTVDRVVEAARALL